MTAKPREREESGRNWAPSWQGEERSSGWCGQKGGRRGLWQSLSGKWKPFEANSPKHSIWFYLIYRGPSSASNPRGHLVGNISSQIFMGKEGVKERSQKERNDGGSGFLWAASESTHRMRIIKNFSLSRAGASKTCLAAAYSNKFKSEKKI